MGVNVYPLSYPSLAPCYANIIQEGEHAATAASLKHQLATMLYEIENEKEMRKRAEERLPAMAAALAAARKGVEDRCDRARVHTLSLEARCKRRPAETPLL